MSISDRIYFHENHGKNLKISPNRLTCRRTNTEFFQKGLCFTSRPLQINERFHFRFIETSDDLGCFLYVGFTSKDPTHFNKATSYADLTNKPGYWAWFFPKGYHNHQVLFYYLSPSGKVHYGVDDRELGTFGDRIKVQGPLWGLLDLFGTLNSVKIVHEDVRVGLVETVVQRGELQLRQQHQQALVRFHRNHGSNIEVEDHMFATHVGCFGGGLVFTSRPMRLYEKVGLRVVKMPVTSTNLISFGFTTEDPEDYKGSGEGPRCYLDVINNPGYWMWPLFKNCCREDSVIFFYVDQFGEVHFGVDDVEKGCFYRKVNVRKPVWALVDVSGNTTVELLRQDYDIRDNLYLDFVAGANGDDEKLCVICYDNEVDTVLQKCGHGCLCYDCAMEQWRGKGGGHCPLCRAIIKDVRSV